MHFCTFHLVNSKKYHPPDTCARAADEVPLNQCGTQVFKRLEEESDRVDRCLDPETKAKVQNVIKVEMIEKYKLQLIEVCFFVLFDFIEFFLWLEFSLFSEVSTFLLFFSVAEFLVNLQTSLQIRPDAPVFKITLNIFIIFVIELDLFDKFHKPSNY